MNLIKGLTFVALISLVAPISQATAHCRNARAVCDLGVACAQGHDEIRRELDRVVPIPDGAAIGGALSLCKSNESKYQSMDDAGAGCTNEDWIVVGQAVLQGANGNKGACNQLPE